MNKTVLASALALAIGGASAVAEANTAGLTGVWTGNYTFTMFSNSGGFVGTSGPGQAWTWDFDAGTVAIENTTAFFGNVWTAHDTTFNDNVTDYGAPGVNMLFDYQTSTDIPVDINWDVTATGNVLGSTANVLTNSSIILSTSPVFPGFRPFFDGNLIYRIVFPI